MRVIRTAHSPSRLLYACVLPVLVFIWSGGLNGCATVIPQSASLPRNYYLVLGQKSDPLVAATAITNAVISPEERVAALHGIATLFIRRDENDNALLVTEDAINELAWSNTLDNDFSYPASQEISTYDPLPGSTRRSQLYMDIINTQHEIRAIEQFTLLFQGALNEILRSESGESQAQALMRYITLTNTVTIDRIDTSFQSRPIEMILTYENIILYSDLLQFLIQFHQQGEQENLNAARIFEQYIQLHIEAYADQYDWTALALYTALQQYGLIASAQIERIRAVISDTPVSLSHEKEIETIAQGLSRGDGEDLLTLYRLLPAQRERCELAFATLDGLTLLAAESEIAAELIACAAQIFPRDERPLHMQQLAIATIRNGIFQEQLLPNNTFNAIFNQVPAISLAIIEEYIRRDRNVTQAQQYIEILGERFDNEVHSYHAARQFAEFYGMIASTQQMIDYIRVKKNPLLKIALLAEVERSDRSLSTAQRQIIANTIQAVNIS